MAAMPDPLMITVAPTGAETAKADCPQLPTTLEELVATAQECEAAGAAMIHVHIRDDEHRPTLDGGRLKATVDALRESTDLVVQLSTGGSVHDPLETRLKVLDAAPDSCSLTMGTTNFGDDVFMNPWPFVCELYQLSQERGVVPEFELFDLGQVHALHRLLDRYGLPAGGKVHVDLVMGVPGGMNGTADSLVAAVSDLPAATTSWSATGIGRSTLPVMLASLSKGGHLRVGMEDVLTISRGVPVESNAQLVERAVDAGRVAQREPMTPAGARALLGLGQPRLGRLLDRGGPRRDLRAPAHAELGADVLEVRAGRPRGDPQLLGDLAVGESPGHQAGDLELAPGQRGPGLRRRRAGRGGSRSRPPPRAAGAAATAAAASRTPSTSVTASVRRFEATAHRARSSAHHWDSHHRPRADQPAWAAPSRSRALPVRPAASSTRPCAWSTAGSMPGHAPRQQVGGDPLGPVPGAGRVALLEPGAGAGDQEREEVGRLQDLVRRVVPGLGQGDRRRAVPGQQRALGEPPQGGGEALQLAASPRPRPAPRPAARRRRRRGRGPGRRSRARAGR